MITLERKCEVLIVGNGFSAFLLPGSLYPGCQHCSWQVSLWRQGCCIQSAGQWSRWGIPSKVQPRCCTEDNCQFPLCSESFYSMQRRMGGQGMWDMSMKMHRHWVNTVVVWMFDVYLYRVWHSKSKLLHFRKCYLAKTGQFWCKYQIDCISKHRLD